MIKNFTTYFIAFNLAARSNPIYATDSEASLFGCDEPWNMNKFTVKHSILNVNEISDRIPGVQTSFNNFGMQGTWFCAHKEDSDISSMNALLSGHPKIWYIVPFSDADKFERLFKQLAQGVSFGCETAFKHKCFIIPPWILQKHGIKFTRHVQYPGEIIITLYGAYHFGFNAGYNVSESINIASPKFIDFYNKVQLCVPPCPYVLIPASI